MDEGQHKELVRIAKVLEKANSHQLQQSVGREMGFDPTEKVTIALATETFKKVQLHVPEILLGDFAARVESLYQMIPNPSEGEKLPKSQFIVNLYSAVTDPSEPDLSTFYDTFKNQK